MEEKKEPVVIKQETVTIKEEPKKQESEKKIDPPVTRQVSNVAISEGSGGYFKSQFDLQDKLSRIPVDLKN